MTHPARQPIVLVAEDDAIVRHIVVAELAKAGYFAMPCEDGFSALEYLAMGERADALVTDIQLPGSINGLFLAVEARVQRPNLPVIYMSAGSIGAQSMVKGSRLLPKPYRLGDLAVLVHAVIASQAASWEGV